MQIPVLESHFSKAADLQSQICNLIKKETPAQVLSCEFGEIFGNAFFIEDLSV